MEGVWWLATSSTLFRLKTELGVGVGRTSFLLTVERTPYRRRCCCSSASSYHKYSCCFVIIVVVNTGNGKVVVCSRASVCLQACVSVYLFRNELALKGEQHFSIKLSVHTYIHINTHTTIHTHTHIQTQFYAFDERQQHYVNQLRSFRVE